MKNVFKKGFFYLVAFSMVLGNSVMSIDFSIPIAHATPEGKVTICHATGSQSNPWVRTNVSANAVGAHLDHGADVILEDDDNALSCPEVGSYCGDEHLDEGLNEECDDGPQGSDSCTSECTFVEDEGDCSLEITKTDNDATPAPGDNITYTLSITNTGTGLCSAVRLKDYYDTNTSYVTSDPAYDSESSDENGSYLAWYLPTIIEPGYSSQVSLTMKVDEETECNSTITNEARGLSVENGFTDPVYEETTVLCNDDPGLECEGADAEFDVDLYVMGENCTLPVGWWYQIADSEDINLSEAGTYDVVAEVHRSPLGGEYGQDNEEFTLRVNSSLKGPVVLDQPPGVEVQLQDVGTFDFVSGNNTVYMDTSYYCPTSDTLVRNSVDVKKLCLYKQDEPDDYTIKASKVVCEDEQYLPNWGDGTSGPSQIDANTASNYVANSEGKCWLEEGWAFQWGTDVNDAGRDFVGPAGDGWQSFDTITGDGTMAEVSIPAGDISTLKFREVLPKNYIPFAWNQGYDDNGTDDNISAEMYCYEDILNYDNYDFVRNPEAGNTYYCVAFNVSTSYYSPYCGDGKVDPSWEQCDGEKGCTEQCQWEEQEQCSDLVLARYNVNEYYNGGAGDLSSDIYLGSGSYVIPQGAWFPLFLNGNPYNLDNDIASYEDVPGLAVQRLANSVRTVMHASQGSADFEEVDATLEFYNADATSYTSDNSGNNKLEDSGEHPDSVNVHDGVADFYLWANTGDDGFYTNWSIDEDCSDPYSPYCGDGKVDPSWEQCDPGQTQLQTLIVGCSEQCQYITEQCNDLVAAKINVDDVQNVANGNMTSDLFLGSASYKIPSNVWFPLYKDGVYFLDNNDIASYEDVPGLAVQRLANSVRTVMYGTGTGSDKEHIDGNIEFYNADVLAQSSDNSNDTPGINKLEDTILDISEIDGVGSYNAGNDEVWIDNGKSHYWLTTTSADDGFYTDWGIVNDCSEEPICYVEGDPFFASTVVSYEQGQRKDGSDVVVARAIPEQGLELELGKDESNFFSLGFGGWIIVSFDDIFVDGPGNDIKVTEDTWGLPYPLEKADVYASQNGSTWVFLGTADNTNLDVIHTTSEFDLASAGLSWGKYIKVVDTSDPSIHNATGDGYDLNAVEALSPGYIGECKEVITVCKVDEQENPLAGWEMTLYGSNLVTNGNFENPVVTGNSGQWELFNSAAVNWNVNWVNGSHTTEPVLEYQTSLLGTPYEGNQYAELGSNFATKISQDITTIAGVDYELGFAFSPRVGRNLADNKLQVKFDSIDETVEADGTSNSDTDWTYYTFTGTATNTNNTLEFVDLGTDNSYGTFLDNVVLRQVATGVTGENGCVEFSDLPYDNYEVRETSQDGWTQVYPIEPNYFIVDFNEENTNPTVTFVNRLDGETSDNIPVITRLGSSPVQVTQGTAYTDEGATADDVEDGDITLLIVTNNPVDTSTIGTYTVTYNVTDSDGNDAVEVTRTVEVVPGGGRIAYCGDNTVDINLGEQCDDGPEGSDTCSPQCQEITTPPPTCSNCGGGGGVTFAIKGIQSSVSCGAFDISWNTNKISDTILDLGTESGVYTQNINNDTNTLNHSVQLLGLLPNTIYYYKITAIANSNGLKIELGEKTFTTPPAEQCGAVLGEKIEAEPEPLICNFLRVSGSSGVDKDVEGVFEYPNGSLLRDACDRGEGVYLIKDQKKWHVPTWKYLHDHHFGQRIYNVASEVISSYPDWTPQVLGVKEYADGTLLRGPDKKVYILEEGHKRHIKTLKELLIYRGQEIINVSQEVIDRY